MASRSTIRTNAWDSIYNYIRTTNAISTEHIYSSLNGKLVSEVGYPFVIIFPPSTTFDKVTVTGEYTESNVAMLIEIYHTSSENCKKLADEVTAKLLAGRTTFAGERLMNMAIEDGGYDNWEEGSKKIHRIGMTVGFRFVSN